jgi:hypothetical protein
MTTIISVNNNVEPSFFYAVYSGYMNDNPNFFRTATLLPPGTFGTSGSNNQGYIDVSLNSIPLGNISDGTNGFATQGEPGTRPKNCSFQWLGYFKSNYTGTWTFNTGSRDCSYVWVGNNAVTGFTTANATINNGGTSGTTFRRRSRNISLENGIYYPIRIQYGVSSGQNSAACTFYFSNNGGLSDTNNGYGYFYNIDNGVMRP